MISRPRITRLFAGSGALYLVAWLAAALADTLSPGRVPWHAQLHLALFGFIGMVLFGMSYLFVPNFAGRMLARTDLALAHLVLAHAGAAGGFLALAGGAPELAWFAALLYLAGGGLWTANLLLTLRRPKVEVLEKGLIPLEALDGADSPRKRVDRWARVATSFVPLYLMAALAAFAAAYRGAIPYAPALHLYTTGVVLLMVIGAGYHLFPRFTGAVPDPRIAALNVLLGAVGPAAVGLSIQGALAFPAAAALEAAAALLFAGFVLDSLRRTGRSHPSYAFYGTSAASLAVGVSLGVAFALRPEWRVHAALHAWLNLLGFAGFMIVGVTLDALVGYHRNDLRERREFRALQLSGLAGLLLLLGSYLGAPTRAAGLVLLLLFAGHYAARLGLKFRSVAEAERRLAAPPPRELQPFLTVTEAIRGFPRFRPAFQELGVDGCCMERTLAHFAQAKGLTYPALVERLTRFKPTPGGETMTESAGAASPRLLPEAQAQEEAKCLLCGAPESRTLLLQARKQGKPVWVCPAEMPRLIHGGG